MWVTILCDLAISLNRNLIMIKNITLPLLITFCAMPYLCTANAMSSIQQSALKTHNYLREQHSAPPLQWENQLAKYAANHAKRCQFTHSHGPYGENLAAGYPSVAAAIHAWYGENQYYSFWFPRFSNKTGHFTQLVWKSSTHVGCAVIGCHGKNGTPGEFLVCEYNPPGNVINAGYFKENVLPRM